MLVASKTNSHVTTARNVVNLYFSFFSESYDSKAEGKKSEARKIESRDHK